jgi:hypothetical protein
LIVKQKSKAQANDRKAITILKAIKIKKCIKFKWVYNKTLCDWTPEEEC